MGSDLSAGNPSGIAGCAAGRHWLHAAGVAGHFAAQYHAPTPSIIT
jgi:hypothetical protein